MVRCAYCGAEGKMSRQHVIPKGFINNMNFKALTVWLDKASSKVINSELMVKDVCAECNNGELSQLDAYALKLIISYNEKILYETRKVFFKYNYDLLTRWLLKVCYNLLAGKTLIQTWKLPVLSRKPAGSFRDSVKGVRDNIRHILLNHIYFILRFPKYSRNIFSF